MTPEESALLTQLQPLLSMPRETLPQLTADQARRSLAGAAEALGVEFIEITGVAPTFLLLPKESTPDILLFGTWHAESMPVEPAAVVGAERLALAVALAGAGRAESTVGAVVAPGATQGSLVLAQVLREHRDRLRAPIALWPRIGPRAPRRRRIFLGARGRVVLGLWGGDANPYRLRDRLVEALRQETYGPRPLDFELIHKLAGIPEALDFLEEAGDGQPADPAIQAEARLTQALFDPRGQVMTPQVKHPDRPQAWLIFDVAENADPDQLLSLAREHGEGTRVEMAEGFPWDRLGIHHPAIQAQIKLSKEVSEGPEIWPSAPWMSPSGVFTRALGTPLAEWSIPIHPGIAVRFPSAADFQALAGEAERLIRTAAYESCTPGG
jgi:hypothetical protein